MKASLRLSVGLTILLLATQAHAMRWYSPSTGRWLSRDPIGEQGGLNLYGFCGNNGIDRNDPLGLKSGMQCELSGTGALLAFTFDGSTLSGNGLSLPAVSGVPIVNTTTRTWQIVTPGGFSVTFGHDEDVKFDYSVERQKLRDVGPVPAGEYYIEKCEERSASTSPYSHIVKRSAWGDYSWSLHAEPTTQTYGRNGFFIHGGSRWGSKGCIDLESGDTQFHNLLKGIGVCGCCYIPVTVKYTVQQATKSDSVTDRTITVPVGW
jgi:hypothetical protein